MRRATRIFVTPLIAIPLLAPVVICNFVSSLTVRLVVVVFATTGFIALLSSFTRAQTVKLVIAGATYVRVANTNGLQKMP